MFSKCTVVPVVLLLAGCGGSTQHIKAKITGPRYVHPSCSIHGDGSLVAPDPNCTPGAVDKKVSQANIDSTICTTHGQSGVKLPFSEQTKLKVTEMEAYNLGGSLRNAAAQRYRVDQLIPTDLGGAQTSPKNLWILPSVRTNPKARLDRTLNRLVCSHRMKLSEAQKLLATNWIAAYYMFVKR